MAQELKRLNGFGNFDKFGGYYDAEDVDAELAEKDAEIRRLQRALFIAHAIKAKFKWWWMSECKHNESCKLFPDPRKIKKFTNSAWACSKSQDKCRAKAEEYRG